MLLLAAAAGAALWIADRDPLPAGSAGSFQFVADVDNWQRTDRQRTVSTPYNLSLAADLTRLPLTLGDWTGQDVPQTNLEVFILLEPEQYVQRLYRRPDGRYVWLSLIGSRKSKSFHSPQICYDTDGWRTDVGSERVALARGELYALSLQAEKMYGAGEVARHVVLYFYLWPGYNRNAQDGMVLVKVTAPIFGTVEETLALEREFLRLLFTAAQ